MKTKAIRTMMCSLAMLTLAASAYAQTQGMDRRDDRRDDRAGGRAAKQACKAGDEKTRAECRHEKREVKHGGGSDAANTAPAAKPAQ